MKRTAGSQAGLQLAGHRLHSWHAEEDIGLGQQKMSERSASLLLKSSLNALQADVASRLTLWAWDCVLLFDADLQVFEIPQ